MKLLFALVACYSWDTYTEDVSSATCTFYERCDVLDVIGYASVDECVDEYVAWDAAEGECEGFDKGAAKRCVRGWQELACTAEPSDYHGDCDVVCAEAEDSSTAED